MGRDHEQCSDGANSTVQINIDRWSTDAERARLAKTFVEQGPDTLLDALQDTKRVGFIRLPTTLGYDLRFARQHPDADGTGEGKASVATRITFNKEKQAVELENYTSEPVRLQQVRVTSGH